MLSEIILFRAAMTRPGEMAIGGRNSDFQPRRTVIDPVTLPQTAPATNAKK